MHPTNLAIGYLGLLSNDLAIGYLGLLSTNLVLPLGCVVNNLALKLFECVFHQSNSRVCAEQV